jgi:signal transduction histidine kinase
VRRLRLRSQLSIVALFLAAYTAAIGFSYRVENRAQRELEQAFQQDLAALARLPRLGDLLRQEALLSQQYLLSGRPEWLADRLRALAEIHRLQRDMAPLLVDPAERELWLRLEAQLAAFAAEQEQWIGRRRAGRLSPGSAVEVLSRTEALESLLDVLLAMRDRNATALQARREAARRASQVTFLSTLGTGVAIGGLMVAFVSWYVIVPLTRLEDYARHWTLGQDWTLPASKTGPEIEGLFMSLRDMSARLNEEFAKERDLARFKGQLVSMVSHEFSNALSIISGATVLLEETDSEGPEKRQPYYAMLKGNVQALGGAAQNLLNMGRLESGQFALSRRKTALGDVVRPCAQRLELLSLRKNQRVAVELPAEPLPVSADPDALSLVMTNLIGNAIKYTPEKGSIFVRVESDPQDAGRVRVSVRDTGIGIRPEDAERIFSGFFRTEKGQETAKGFGVGLSLAKRIVEAHDSVLRVDSAPGKGSTFWFTLPLWNEAAQLQEVA